MRRWQVIKLVGMVLMAALVLYFQTPNANLAAVITALVIFVWPESP